MKLYKTHNTADRAAKAVWTASQTDASKARTAMQAALKAEDKPHKDVVIDAVDIDTKKEGLLAFLNGPER